MLARCNHAAAGERLEALFLDHDLAAPPDAAAPHAGDSALHRRSQLARSQTRPIGSASRMAMMQPPPMVMARIAVPSLAYHGISVCSMLDPFTLGLAQFGRG